MSNPFDRTLFGALEVPVSSGLNTITSQADRALRDVLRLMLSGRTPYSGFLGTSFQVSVVAAGIQVSPGIGFMVDPATETSLGTPGLAAGVDDLSTLKPMCLAAPALFPSPPKPDVGMTRIDLIEVRADRRLQDPLSLVQEDPGDPSFGLDDVILQVFPRTLSYALDGHTGVTSSATSTAPLSYRLGTAAPSASAAAPTPTPGYVPVALVVVTGGAGFATLVIDQRALLAPGGAVSFSGSWRVQWNFGSPIVTALAIQAPPGVQVGMRAQGIRGTAELWVIGGGAKSGSATMTTAYTFGLTSTTQFAIGMQTYDASASDQLITMTDTDVTRASLSTPPVIGAKGSVALHSTVASRSVSLTGINTTDPSLEDMVVRVSGALSYV